MPGVAGGNIIKFNFEKKNSAHSVQAFGQLYS